MIEDTLRSPSRSLLRDLPSRFTAHRTQILRYGWAAAGPISIALVQFALSLKLLHSLPTAAFGTFAFLMVASQFSAGLWSALFCAPLPVLLAEGSEAAGSQAARTLFIANLGAAGVAFALFACMTAVLAGSALAALLFAAYAALSLLRWYARTYAYTIGSPWKATTSDLVFSGLLLLGFVALLALGRVSLSAVYALMAFSVAVALISFGPAFLSKQFLQVSGRDLGGYADVWRRHSSWSLIGVVSTEATVNAHAYILTLIAGPTAFAPVAASALLIRPIAVVTNALTDLERPRIARHIGRSEMDQAQRAVGTFRLVLVAIWAMTAAGGLVLMASAPRIVFPPQYAIHSIELGIVLWMLVAGTRLFRQPESVLLQAAGAFRLLAYASIFSSGVSIISVCLLLHVFGPMWSIVGVWLGEQLFTSVVRHRARVWAKAHSIVPICQTTGNPRAQADLTSRAERATA